MLSHTGIKKGSQRPPFVDRHRLLIKNTVKGTFLENVIIEDIQPEFCTEQLDGLRNCYNTVCPSHEAYILQFMITISPQFLGK